MEIEHRRLNRISTPKRDRPLGSNEIRTTIVNEPDTVPEIEIKIEIELEIESVLEHEFNIENKIENNNELERKPNL